MSSSWGWPEAKISIERLSARFSTWSQSRSSENWPQAFAHSQAGSALVKDAGSPELQATNGKQAEHQEHKEAVVQQTKERKLFMSSMQRKHFFDGEATVFTAYGKGQRPCAQAGWRLSLALIYSADICLWFLFPFLLEIAELSHQIFAKLPPDNDKTLRSLDKWYHRGEQYLCFSVLNIATLPTALAAAQLRAAPLLWGPWRELGKSLLGFLEGAETPWFGLQLSYSINPGVTAELTYLAVSALRRAQIIHGPAGGCDRQQPLSDGSQVLCWTELGQHGREVSRTPVLKSEGPGLSKVTKKRLCTNYSFPFHQDLAAFSLHFILCFHSFYFCFSPPQYSSLAIFQSFPLDISSPHVLLHMTHWSPPLIFWAKYPSLT